MTKIIMVRHGQSEANEQSRFAGHSDFDLTELGRKQARLAAEYLFGRERVDVIYSSDLKRAHNTAEPFSSVYGLSINDTAALREIYAGYWEGKTVAELIEEYPEDMKAWRDDFSNARCTGGEAVAELYARMVPAVCEIAERHIGQTVLITTHATPVRAIECYSRGWGAERMAEVPFVRNSAISIFEYDETDKSIKAVRTDIVEHLDESLVTTVTTEFEAKPV